MSLPGRRRVPVTYDDDRPPWIAITPRGLRRHERGPLDRQRLFERFARIAPIRQYGGLGRASVNATARGGNAAFVSMRLWVAFVLVVGCAESHGLDPGDETGVTVGPDGRTGAIPFEVPAGATAITVMIEGDPSAMLALGSLRFSDGIEHAAPVAIADLDPALGIVGEGVDRQFPRLGTFVLQYPTLASQALPVGPATLTVISDRPGTAVRVRIISRTDEPRTVHVSLVSFSSAMPLDDDPRILDEARAMMASAGVTLVIDEQVFLGDGPAFGTMVGGGSPDDEGARLLRQARAGLSTDAFPIVFVEHVADLAFGASRGLPCPPDASSYYYGVFIDPTVDSGADDGQLVARVIAHELGHALGLPHVDDTPRPGVSIADPFADTAVFDDTIMGSALLGAALPERSLRFSAQQAFAMTRSALLR